MEEGDGFGISPLQMGLMLLLLFIFMYWLVYKDYKSEKNAERQTWNRLSYKSSERKRDRKRETSLNIWERESAERASVDAVVAKKEKANERERALDYDSAIEIWEDLGEIKEAARVRKLKTEEGSVKVTQKVVHGDEVTEIKDSVVSKSNVGAGGKTKGERIKLIKELLDSGAIDKDDYEKMKREIVG